MRIRMWTALCIFSASFLWIAFVWNYKKIQVTQRNSKLCNVKRIPDFENSSKAPMFEKNFRSLQSKQCQLEFEYDFINSIYYESTIGTTIAMKKTSPRRKNVKPMFSNTYVNLRRDKFLYPVVYMGPNNQLGGFEDTIFLAIMLNRTIVLPRFLKHRTDRQRSSAAYISPVHRIDVEKYCKFVSCLTLDSFQEACDFKVDAILNTKFLSMEDIKKIEQLLGMTILSDGPKNNFYDNSALSSKFLPPNRTSSSKPDGSFLADEIQSLFTSSAKCVIYPYAFMDLEIINNKGDRVKLRGKISEKSTFAIKSSPDLQLYRSINQHYRRPQYIRRISQEFVSNIINGQVFLALHWRYNYGDFVSEHHCNSKITHKRVCNFLANFTSEDLADRIVRKLTALIQKQGIKINHVYIASPLTQRSIDIEKTSKILNKQGLVIYTSEDLMKFIESQYIHTCKFLSRHFDDIFSTVEMEICSNGIVFLGSAVSTWTNTVHRSRLFGNISGIQPDFDEFIIPIEELKQKQIENYE